MSDEIIKALVYECRRQEESCLYTSASLLEWQKYASLLKAMFLIIPIVLGGIGGAQVFGDLWGNVGKGVAVSCALVAGFFPTIYVALNMDMRVVELSRSASEFTNLRDRFRQAANIGSQSPLDEFKAQFELLMDRMDAARSAAPPSPEWCFRKAQKKIGHGDYTWDSAPRNG